MGLFKDTGYPALALAEECAEVIQILAKAARFGEGLDTKRPGAELTRYEELELEMADLIYQWERLKKIQEMRTA
jgi:NTP pyrophosphatase (non-canonical NTP hydrolase)